VKIIYSAKHDLIFENYGVMIPIVHNRAERVFLEQQKLDSHLEEIKEESIPNIEIDDLKLVHQAKYVEELFDSYHHLEYHMLKTYELIDSNGNYHRYDPSLAKFDFSHALKTILKQVGLTYYAAKLALSEKEVYYLGGGMHHAMTDIGRGFCLVNDVAIAIRKLQNEKLIQKAWIIDVDAHKGDGAAEIFKHDNSVVTFSIHMQEGWPLNTGSVRDPWFIPSNIDIGIGLGEDDRYIEKLQMGLLELKEKYPRPDLVFVVQGADPYELDELESANLLKLSKAQMLQRDKLVYEFIKTMQLPQVYVMAGGYGHHSYEIYDQFLKFVRQSSS